MQICFSALANENLYSGPLGTPWRRFVIETHLTNIKFKLSLMKPSRNYRENFSTRKALHICCCFGLGLITSINLFGQLTKSGAATDQTRADIESKAVVWAVPAEQKVRPDDAVEKSNLVWSDTDKTIRIAGAGNEHVPFQVIITTPIPPGRRPKAPDGFFIEASKLTSGQGKEISESHINLYLEHYIVLYAKSSPVGETGYWPDALAPI